MFIYLNLLINSNQHNIQKGANQLMGIDGLLKFLRPITEKEHISTFKNQRAGVDLMSWIYRGCYSCNYELTQKVDSVKYLYFLLEMVEILSYYKIEPVFIIDGRSFDLKADTNQKRIKQKEEAKAKAEQLMKQGKIQEARKYFSRCIFIDQKIISTTMNVMHSRNIPFYVAPYESDCQIAKLKKLGIINVAISQDSDLIAYGVNTILKLNHNGDCDYIDPNKWAPRDVDSQFLKEYFAMGYVNRVQCAILAGTDYNPSIRGIGIKRAVKLLYRQAKMCNVINKLKQQKVYKDRIPQNYEELIEKVKMIFLFATVYNPMTKKLDYLNPDLIETCKPNQMSEQQLMKIVGQHYPEYLQKQVHLGKTKAKDLTPRQFSTLLIRENFTVNKENLIAHDALNRKRRLQQKKLKIQRQKQMEQGKISVDDMAPNHSNSSKISPTKTGASNQEDKEKSKIDRKNRILKLQDVMNSVVQMCEQEDFQEQQSKSKSKSKSRNSNTANKEKQVKQTNEEQKDNPMEALQRKLHEVSDLLEKQKNRSGKVDTMNEQSSDESESSQEEEQMQEQQSSEVINLSFLNPFMKSNITDNQKTAEKQAKK